MRTRSTMSSRRAALLSALVAGALCVPGASAQAPANPNPNAPSELTPPVPTPPQKLSTNYMAIMEAFVLGALVIGVNFIPSKRGHQD